MSWSQCEEVCRELVRLDNEMIAKGLAKIDNQHCARQLNLLIRQAREAVGEKEPQ